MTLELAWAFLSERIWSLAARHECPPESYAGYFVPGQAAQVVATMMREAAAMYWLEKRKLADTVAADVWRDCHCAQSKPVRMMFAFFERDGEHSRAGCSLLRGCLHTLADNKAVEELHHSCKLDVKGRSNKRQPGHHLQHTVISSQVLESRRIPHSVKVTKESFMAKWRHRSKLKNDRGRHDACKHRLPRAWSNIMSTKQWRTTNEATDRTSASAWRWLRQFAPGGAPRAGIGLQDAMLSHWVLPMTIFKKLGDDSPYMASMGRGKWSILAWPMNTEPGAEPDRRRFHFITQEETKPEWQAVLDLDAYEVVPYTPMLTEGLTICLEQNGVAEPLAKSSLRAAGLLSHADLVLAALKYNLDVARKTRAQLLALLAQFVAPGDSDFAALVAKDVAPSDVLCFFCLRTRCSKLLGTRWTTTISRSWGM